MSRYRLAAAAHRRERDDPAGRARFLAPAPHRGRSRRGARQRPRGVQPLPAARRACRRAAVRPRRAHGPTCGCRSGRRPSSTGRPRATRGWPGACGRCACTPTASASTRPPPTAACGTRPTAPSRGDRSAGSRPPTRPASFARRTATPAARSPSCSAPTPTTRALDTVYVGTGEITPGRTRRRRHRRSAGSASSSPPGRPRRSPTTRGWRRRPTCSTRASTGSPSTRAGRHDRGRGDDDRPAPATGRCRQGVDWERVAGDPVRRLRGRRHRRAVDACRRRRRTGAAVGVGAAATRPGSGCATTATPTSRKVAYAGFDDAAQLAGRRRPAVAGLRVQRPGQGDVAKLYRGHVDGRRLPRGRGHRGVPDMLGHQGFYDLAVHRRPEQPRPGGPRRLVLRGPAGRGARSSARTSTPPATPTRRTPRSSPPRSATPPGRSPTGTPRRPLRDRRRLPRRRARPPTSPTPAGCCGQRCDGGVFRSIFPDQNSAFVARNNGLAVVEANYVACHPSCEGRVVVGLQDNGIIERALVGGVGATPATATAAASPSTRCQPTRYVRQYFNGQWTASDGGPYERMLAFRPIAAPLALHADAAKERDAAAFYSTVVGDRPQPRRRRRAAPTPRC